MEEVEDLSERRRMELKPMQWRWLTFAAAIVVLGAGLPARSAVAQGGTSAGEAAEGEERKLTKSPKLEKEVEAEYTDEALEEEVEGNVVLKLRISEKGDVEEVEVVEGLGHGLDAEAIRAARQFKFEPAEIDGEPAPVVLNFKIRFELPIRPATFRGQVSSKGGDDEGKPVEGVLVRIEYLGDEYDPAPEAQTATDAEGRFQFREIPPGRYRVQFEAARYRSVETEITLEDDETYEAEYRLPRKAVDLAGEIVEAGTRERLAGIRIRVLSPPDASKEGDDASPEVVREVYTDDNGRFGVRGLDPGEYRIAIDAEGYQSKKYTETVTEGDRLEVTYYLKANYYDEYTVTTTAERERETVDRDTLQLEEVRRIPGTGGDPVRAVQNMPGVARPSFASGQLVVRGSTPQSTRTFVQGDEIPLVYHFLGGPAVINAEMLDSVDFYPGNYRAKYGRALAGIVDLQTRKPKSDRLHGFSEVDFLDATAQLEGPITDDVSFAVSGRRSYVDAFLPAVVPDDALGFRVAPHYYDYQGWLSWEVDDSNRLELFLYGSNDRIEALFDADNPQGNSQIQITGLEYKTGFHRGQARWEWRPEDLPFENDLMVAFGGSRVGFEGAENLFFRLKTLDGVIRNDFRWELSDRAQFNAGIDTSVGRAKYSAEVPGFDTDGDQGGVSEAGLVAEGKTQWSVQPAVYSELELEMIDGLRLVPGLRLDYYGAIEEASISPRFNGRVQITDAIAAKAGVGLFTQPPSPQEVSKDFGNPDLTYQKAGQYSAGAVFTPLEFLELDATFFYRDLYDLVIQTNEVQRDRDTGEFDPLIYNNAGRGRAFGLELLLRHYPANKFFGWLAYTLSRSERKDPVTGEWNVYSFDQTHNLTLVAGYNLPWNIDVSARFRVVTGNPDTPIVGGVWNADTDSYTPVYGEPNSVRNDTFHQLDLRVDKEFVFNTWRLGIYLDVINAYNANNQEGTRYNFDYSESKPIPGLPIIPTLGVNGRF